MEHSVWIVAFLALYGAGLCFLLWVTRWKRKWYAMAKGCLSVLFVLCGAASYAAGEGQKPGAFAFLLVALVLCASGDVLLGIANRQKKVRARPFLAGALSFSLAHITFCILYSLVARVQWYDFVLPLALVLMVLLLEKSGKIKPKKMRPVIYTYVVLVGFMASKAWSAAFIFGVSTALGVLTMVGAAAFLVSDAILLFLYFGTSRHRFIRYANLISYYCSILLLALTAYWY